MELSAKRALRHLIEDFLLDEKEKIDKFLAGQPPPTDGCPQIFEFESERGGRNVLFVLTPKPKQPKQRNTTKP